jgi:hypothetical protein
MNVVKEVTENLQEWIDRSNKNVLEKIKDLEKNLNDIKAAVVAGKELPANLHDYMVNNAIELRDELIVTDCERAVLRMVKFNVREAEKKSGLPV